MLSSLLSRLHVGAGLLALVLLLGTLFASCGSPQDAQETEKPTRAESETERSTDESRQTETVPESGTGLDPETSSVDDSSYPARLVYEFDEHADNRIPGCIAGTIRIEDIPDSVSAPYLLLYFADDRDLLAGYDELLSIPYSGSGSAVAQIKDGTYLPREATRLMVIPSKSAFQPSTPSLDLAVGSYRFPAGKHLVLPDAPLFTFGAVSDVHMNYESYDRGAYQKWANALQFYKQNTMDIVVIGGDLTGDDNLESDYRKYNEILDDSRYDPDDVFECTGNHGNTKNSIRLFIDAIATGDEIFPAEGVPYYHVEKGNNIFIFMAQELKSPGDSASYDNFSKEQIDWLESLLKQHYGKDKNIFILEHSPFLDFGPGDRYKGDYTACVTFNPHYTNTMRLKSLLSTYRDIILMSGHTHLTLYDQENYSSFNGAFARMIHLPSSCQPCGYGQGSTYTKSYDGRKAVTPTYGSETYLCYVYEDYILYIGYNLSTGTIIPGACLLLQTHLDYTDIPSLEDEEPEEISFSGAGTQSDPFLIRNSQDFYNLTVLFNQSTDQNHMYGQGLYFLQTEDIDMTGFKDYDGTFANGNSKCFFSGFYDGDGHSIRVDINSSGQKSVFPYTYGTIQNLSVKGKIKTSTSAQPFRTNYGTIANVVIEMELDSDLTHGVCYSNYGTVANVVSRTTLSGNTRNPVSSNTTNDNLTNVFFKSNASGGYGSALTNTDAALTTLNSYADAHGYVPFCLQDGQIELDPS